MLKIATWNVNSLKVRLPHVLQWLSTHQPDVLALQEIKMLDEFFPLEEIKNAGYDCVINGQKTYNGMAILSKKKCTDVIKDIPELHDPQRRVLGVTIEDIRLLNLYVPNGESVSSEKYIYKLNWLKHLDLFLKSELKKYPNLIILGDFNIAPHEIDVHEPMLWEGRVLFSEKERAAFQDILSLGFVDCYRALSPNEKKFTWWDYRTNAFKRKMGLRIDHILASELLVKHCKKCDIDTEPRAWERPSDHAPVIAKFE
jgi:exodeoxyribonuclease-3